MIVNEYNTVNVKGEDNIMDSLFVQINQNCVIIYLIYTYIINMGLGRIRAELY